MEFFFNIHDLINQATINVEDNEYGGKTTTKITYEDKTVTFIKTENSLWTSTIVESNLIGYNLMRMTTMKL